MNENKKEDFICSHCIHREVCKFKENYYNILDMLTGVFIEIPKENREGFVFNGIDCKNYAGSEFSKDQAAKLREAVK